MAGLMLELLVGLLLLLSSVRSWERIDDNQLVRMNDNQLVSMDDNQLVSMDEEEEEDEDGDGDEDEDEDGDEDGDWTDADDLASEGDGYEDDLEPFPEDELPEVEGAATSNMDDFADYGFHEESDGPVSDNLSSSTDDPYEVGFSEVPSSSWTSSTSSGSNGLDVVCSETGFQITLQTGQISEVRVLGSTEVLPVMEAPEYCGYDVNPLNNTLTVPFGGCHVKHSFQTDGYRLELLYINDSDQTQVATAYCEESLKFDPGLRPRSAKPKGKCSIPPAPAQNCAVVAWEQVPCGGSGVSPEDCKKIGCCVDSHTDVCYYPLDECTGDKHFVFAIRVDSASIPVDTTKLVVPGYPHCTPVIVTDKVAIFKFGVTECGVRACVVGETKIYLAEVQTVIHALNLKYGVITRSDPLKFLVECRYSKHGGTYSLASVGYMVKTPSSTLPSSVIGSGLYGVQLRISKGKRYRRFFPTYRRPLRRLLGQPVYLELRLATRFRFAKAVILVNYCLAYPFSAKNALVLVYENCANPFDTNVSILKVRKASKVPYTKRLVVSAFQFMDQTTNKYLDEEIYFMCSAEVCFPSEKHCEDKCP